MTELFLAILAVNAVIWWLVMVFWILRPERIVKHTQQGKVRQEHPGNYVCMAPGCAWEGFVVSFAGYFPTCVHCGAKLAQVAGSYWTLEKRVAELEANNGK